MVVAVLNTQSADALNFVHFAYMFAKREHFVYMNAKMLVFERRINKTACQDGRGGAISGWVRV